MFSLQQPRHIPTLPFSTDQRCLRDVRFPPDRDQIAYVAALRFRAGKRFMSHQTQSKKRSPNVVSNRRSVTHNTEAKA